MSACFAYGGGSDTPGATSARRIPRAAHRPPRWSWSAQRGCGGKLLQHISSHVVRRGSYQVCRIYLKLFLGRPLESAKPLKFLWKAFPELSDAFGGQPRGTKERPGTPPVCFKGSHGQPKRAQRRPKTVQVATEMPKESYQNAVCNAFSQRCASEWRFKQFSQEFAAISHSPDPYDSMAGTAYPALL